MDTDIKFERGDAHAVANRAFEIMGLCYGEGEATVEGNQLAVDGIAFILIGTLVAKSIDVDLKDVHNTATWAWGVADKMAHIFRPKVEVEDVPAIVEQEADEQDVAREAKDAT